MAQGCTAGSCVGESTFQQDTLNQNPHPHSKVLSAASLVRANKVSDFTRSLRHFSQKHESTNNKLEQLEMVGNYRSTGKKQKNGCNCTATMNSPTLVLDSKGKHWATALHPAVAYSEEDRKATREPLTSRKTHGCLKDMHCG